LVTTFVAICLGLSAAFPPVGIVISTFALLALLRTLIAGRQQLRAGVPFGISEKIETFFTSALMVYFAVGFGFLIVLSFCAVAWLARSLLAAGSRAPTPVEHLIIVLAGIAYWTGLLILPVTAGICFLWATRPRRER
jgi:hypothetical protein